MGRSPLSRAQWTCWAGVLGVLASTMCLSFGGGASGAHAPDGGVGADDAADAGVADEDAGALRIVARDVWDPGGAVGGDRYPGTPARTMTRVVVHHSDFLEPAGALGIKQYHLEVSGFSDIGYHYVIAPDGTVYEGRPLERMGAHAGATREGSRGDRKKDPDYGAVGVVLDGYFGDALPPPPQRAALVALVRELKSRLPKVTEVIGHREVRARVLAAGLHPTSDVTVCPGDALFVWLEAQRALDVWSVKPETAVRTRARSATPAR